MYRRGGHGAHGGAALDALYDRAKLGLIDEEDLAGLDEDELEALIDELDDNIIDDDDNLDDEIDDMDDDFLLGGLNEEDV